MKQTKAPDFLRDTAVEPLGDGRWRGWCSTDWSAPPGPNGGYLAAIVLRAMTAELGDATRPPRSLTLHYLRPPKEGTVEVAVEVQRNGRSLSTLTARLVQDGKDCILAIGAFAATFPSALDYATPPPEVPAWEDIEPYTPHPQAPAISHRLEIRGAIGQFPFTSGDHALTGGWILLHDKPAVDAHVLALLCDAWLPAAFVRLDNMAMAPTIDFTIHFRNPDAAAAHDPSTPLLTRFSSETSVDGFWEEDGAVWTPDGTLLAQSRQLALLRPFGEQA
jgi:acyl-CoA thioesterase